MGKRLEFEQKNLGEFDFFIPHFRKKKHREGVGADLWYNFMYWVGLWRSNQARYKSGWVLISVIGVILSFEDPESEGEALYCQRQLLDLPRREDFLG